MKPTFYATSPIYYVNDIPHIGHAYTSMACDFIARFKRLDGYDVHFLTGTDEHGQKIERSAEKAGINPQEFVDNVSIKFRELMEKMNFSHDVFMRTSETRHKEYVQNIWSTLCKKGFIYEDKYCGWYAVRDEAFYDKSELIDGKAPTGAEVEWVEEPSYFFKLSDFGDKLLEYYDAHPDFIAPESRRNEVISFVKSGLHDLSVSRTSFSWGINVPGNDKHVMYVWLDALFNYISAIGGETSRYWPADLHIVGKDILRFHAVYWPAFLMAAEIPLPKRVYAHGWWTNNGEKISKSLGNVIDPLQLIEKFGLDYIRYFLMREIPFGNDGNYTESNLINRINSELANNIGNLSQRILSFAQKYCSGVVPTVSLQEVDTQLLNKAYSTIDQMRASMDSQSLNAALGEIVALGSAANEYVDHQAPWRLKESDPKRMEEVLYTMMEVIRVIAIMLQPVTPQAAAVLLGNLGISEPQDFSQIKNTITPGAPLPAPVVAFPRIELK